MSREELQDAYDTAHRGGGINWQPIYAKIFAEKSKRAARNKSGKAAAAASAPIQAEKPAEDDSYGAMGDTHGDAYDPVSDQGSDPTEQHASRLAA